MKKIKTIFILFAFLLIFIGCASDISDPTNNKIMKSWQLESMLENNTILPLTDCQKGELIYFTEKNVCYLYFPCDSVDLRSAWNYDATSKILNISDFLPITYYVQQLDDENLKIKYYEYDSIGNLNTFSKHYKSAQTELIEGKLRTKE